MHVTVRFCLFASISILVVLPCQAQSAGRLKQVPVSTSRSTESPEPADLQANPAQLRLTPDTEIRQGSTGRHQFFSPGSPDRRRSEKNMRYSEVQNALESLLQEWEQSDTASTSDSDRRPPTESIEPPSGDWTPADTDPAATEESLQDAATRNASTQDPAELDRQALLRLNLPADALVEGPVDRVALADNLYALGEYTLAKEMYNRVEMEHLLPAQQFWVQFQNASCLRQLGDTDGAKSQLRILAGQEKDAGWLAHSARWWLDTIDDRAELEQQIAETQRQLDTRRENHRESKSR